ncbi:hypothetical protein [Priestia endophytica]|uniref:hypothetical protein n=1 Tax=Priestia endophytica TaxID=135735 RepID=UPI002E1AE195|nr:hypothetical protein [Priestia endophytica]
MAPTTPLSQVPVSTKRTNKRPVFESKIGTDAEKDAKHFGFQLADDEVFTTNVQQKDTKPSQTGWKVKTTSGSFVRENYQTTK